MSTLNVVITKVEIFAHPNADRLDIARIGGQGGYECVVTKGEFNDGSLTIFVPPDSVLPDNILKFQQEHKKISIPGGRVKAVNVRGKLSEGLCLLPDQWLHENNIKENKDVTELLCITKYEPPPPRSGNVFGSGKGINRHYNNPNFHKYTSIDNIKKHPKVFKKDENVVATVKMHGTNFRCGWVKKHDYKKSLWEKFKDLVFKPAVPLIINKNSQEFLVGSHNVIRHPKDKNCDLSTDLYWRAALKYNLKDATKKMAEMLAMVDQVVSFVPTDIILYAEIIGPNIQTGYNYGIDKDEIEIRVFDIKWRGEFISWNDIKFLCMDHRLPHAEEIYVGPWYHDVVKKASSVDVYASQKYVREGIVIKPVTERWSDRCGRVIFKSISPEYLLNKNNTEYH